MDTRHGSSFRLVFGPFEVDVRAQQVRKSGIPIRLSGQPLQILLILLETPNEGVAREQLRERIWPDGTFVDFEHGLNAAINKLRRALGDSAENPRYIETIPGLGYRFIGAVNSPAVQSATAAPVSPVVSPAPPSVRWWLPVVGMAVLLLSVLLFISRRPTQPAKQPALKLIRLTATAGVSENPALSPDGKFVAYASDEGEDRGDDIYIKAIAGGQPVRLTFDGEGNHSPDFSPDGTRIVFRSGLDGGGVYEIPVLGGQRRLIARGGLSPKYSPDGTRISYWTGTPSVAGSVPGTGQIWVIPSVGGTPKQVGAQLASARHPVWTPDGKSLLVFGYSSSRTFDQSGVDWWLIPSAGGEPIRSGAVDAMTHAGLALRGNNNQAPVPDAPSPGCWSLSGDQMVFSIRNGVKNDLWQILLSPNGLAAGPPERITTGSGNEIDPACSGDKIAFSDFDNRSDIWLLPIDSSKGSGDRLKRPAMPRPGIRDAVSLTKNGRFLAITSDQADKPNIWLRDLATGKESIIASSPLVQRYPLSNESGTRVIYSVYENDKRVLYASSPGGIPEKLCEGCLRPTDWTQDEKKAIVFGGTPYSINVLDLGSHQQTVLVKHPEYSVLYGRISPDNRWISFTVRVNPAVGRITVAPLNGLSQIAESSWSPIADVSIDDYAMWSDDGKTLYYSSPRDGNDCLWGQKFDPASGRSSGAPFAIHHFHGRLFYDHLGWAAGGGLFAIPLTENTGSIWMLSR